MYTHIHIHKDVYIYTCIYMYTYTSRTRTEPGFKKLVSASVCVKHAAKHVITKKKRTLTRQNIEPCHTHASGMSHTCIGSVTHTDCLLECMHSHDVSHPCP